MDFHGLPLRKVGITSYSCYEGALSLSPRAQEEAGCLGVLTATNAERRRRPGNEGTCCWYLSQGVVVCCIYLRNSYG